MNSGKSDSVFRCIVLSVVKHAYVPNGVANHPRFQLVAVADDPDQPDWVHERNQKYADDRGIPYVRNVEKAIRDFDVQVAVVSPEAERHANLSVRAAQAGLHVVQDKPMSNRLAECDRIVQAVEHNRVKFLLWNRNGIPAIQQAHELLQNKAIGQPRAIHVDFYFSKDAGPPKGSRQPGESPLNWLEMQIAAHVDGSDGGVGKDPMGELQIEGIYPLAYIHLLAGLNVNRVFARTTAHFHQLYVDNDIDDLATVTLEMQNGMLGTLSIGRIGAASHPDIGEIKLHILGTEGALVISEARPEVGVHYRGQPEKEFRNRRLAIDNDYFLMDNFAQAIDDDGETVLDARAARNISAIVAAALESGRTGKPVDVH
ncbi:MAG: Gfo/Idh/MocA family protein [Planctomycetaceae bacterium]